MKKWNILPAPPAEFIDAHPELPPIITRLLWNRNLREQKQIDEFLNPDYSADIHDPFLFKQMEKAVAIIFSAIAKEQNIMIHGDYDADGVCASMILVNTLKKLGAKNVDVFLPHREIDGYGLNSHTVKSFQEQKIDLIITCDCGISNFPEVEEAKQNGMRVIITDHHNVPEQLPNADAIIHPKVIGEDYPDKNLCGAGVAFKLVQGLLKRHQEKNKLLPDGQTHEGFEKWMLDMVAIATIGDMVPLLGESRTLTRYGLTVLNKTSNLGLRQLFIVAGIADENGKPKRQAYNSSTVGFKIVPRLNAAGRMDHANTALALLMAVEEKEAEKLAKQLDKNNTERQKLTEKLVNEALEQIKKTGQEKNPIIFAYQEKWPTGVLGLVSGKLKDTYNKPALAMGLSEGVICGSGRSIPEFNIIKNLQEMPEFFEKFGGHPQACGFSLKNKEQLEEFKKALGKKAEEQLTGIELIPQITIEAEVNLEEVDWKLYDLLDKFRPFGQSNEEPKYMAQDVSVVSLDPVGQDGKHLKILVKHNTHLVRKTIAFGLGDSQKHPEDWRKNLKPGEKIDIVFSIGVNEWNGNRELELSVEDIKKR